MKKLKVLFVRRTTLRQRKPLLVFPLDAQPQKDVLGLQEKGIVK